MSRYIIPKFQIFDWNIDIEVQRNARQTCGVYHVTKISVGGIDDIVPVIIVEDAAAERESQH
jgi:hypothetical protein